MEMTKLDELLSHFSYFWENTPTHRPHEAAEDLMQAVQEERRRNPGYEPSHLAWPEMRLLGSILRSDEAMHTAVHLCVPPSSFLHQENATIYRAALSLHARGETVNATTIEGELRARWEFDDIGSYYLQALTKIDLEPTHAAGYAQMLMENTTID